MYKARHLFKPCQADVTTPIVKVLTNKQKLYWCQTLLNLSETFIKLLLICNQPKVFEHPFNIVFELLPRFIDTRQPLLDLLRSGEHLLPRKTVTAIHHMRNVLVVPTTFGVPLKNVRKAAIDGNMPCFKFPNPSGVKLKIRI